MRLRDDHSLNVSSWTNDAEVDGKHPSIFSRIIGRLRRKREEKNNKNTTTVRERSIEWNRGIAIIRDAKYADANIAKKMINESVAKPYFFSVATREAEK